VGTGQVQPGFALCTPCHSQEHGEGQGALPDGKPGAEPGAHERPWVEVGLQRPAVLSRPAGGTPPARPCPGTAPVAEAEGLVLALPADLLLPPRSRCCPGLRLGAIAPTRPLRTGVEVAAAETCTLGMRDISEAITGEKKEKWKPLLLHLNLQDLMYAPQKRTPVSFFTITHTTECNL